MFSEHSFLSTFDTSALIFSNNHMYVCSEDQRGNMLATLQEVYSFSVQQCCSVVPPIMGQKTCYGSVLPYGASLSLTFPEKKIGKNGKLPVGLLLIMGVHNYVEFWMLIAFE